MGRARFARRGRESRLIPAASTVRRDCFLSSPGSLSRLRRFGAWALPGTGVSRLSPDFPFRLVRRGMVLLLAGLWMGDAQAAEVCSSTPGDGDWIKCTEDSTSTDDIVLYVNGVVIRNPGNNAHGIHAEHAGGTPADPANIIVDVTGAATKKTISITTAGRDGIFGKHTGTGNVDIDVTGVGISTGGIVSRGVAGEHTGTGNIDITVKGTTISTTADDSVGVYGKHTGSGDGDIDITVKHAAITTKGNGAGGGIQVFREGTGSGDIDLTLEHTKITTGDDTVDPVTGSNNHGIHVQHTGTGSGDIGITLGHTGITTKGDNADGIFVQHRSKGHITLDLNPGVTLDTTGSGIFINQQNGDTATKSNVILNARGITVRSGRRGLWAQRESGWGDVIMDIRDSAVITTGNNGATGVYAYSTGAGDGDIRVRATNGRTTTKGHIGHGIFAYHQSAAAPPPAGSAVGDIVITLRNHHVATKGVAHHPDLPGTYSYGIFARQENTGDIVIDMRGGSVTTAGKNSHGIVAYNYGDAASMIHIRVADGAVTTSDAHGILASHRGAGGGVNILIRNAFVRASGADMDGIRIQGAGLDANGNRRQTVSVGSGVWGGSGGGAGIRLEGGGRVIIGPHGRVGAASGVSILVTRADPADTAEVPRLLLDVALNGRLPEKVVAGRVANSDGTTAWTVNGVPVFDSAAGGARDVWVQNGAWEVRAAGTSLSTLAFERVFAPRAAVYEALPGVLLRLDARPGGIGDGGRLRSPGTPVWARIAGGIGSYEADSATAGADYDYDRYSAETGVDFPLDYGLTGWAGVRVVSGSADVSAPTGGGRIEARGRGLTGGLAWEGDGDWYGKGRLSLTRYSADLSSSARGTLKSGAGALVHALDLEGGRRFGLDLMGVKTRLTARGALRRSGILLDKFDDGLFSRVSVREGDRLAAGGGVAVETGLLPRDGADRLVLRGSLDAERVLSGGTAVDVSDTVLKSKTGKTGLGAGLGGAYRMAGYAVGGSVGAGGLGSGDTSYSGRLELRIAF